MLQEDLGKEDGVHCFLFSGDRRWWLLPLLILSRAASSSMSSSLLHPTPGVEFSRKVRSLLGSDPQSCPLPLTMLEVFVLLHPSLVLNSMAHFQLVHTAPMAHCAYLAMWCKVDRTCWVSCFSCAGLFHEFSKCIYICLFNDVWILNLTCLRDMHIWYQTM